MWINSIADNSLEVLSFIFTDFFCQRKYDMKLCVNCLQSICISVRKRRKKKKKNNMLSASDWKCILRVKGVHIKSVCEHQKPRPWYTCTSCVHNTWSLWNLLYFRQIALKFCDQMAYANSAYHNPGQQAQIGVNTVCHSTKYFVKQIYKNIGKKKSMEVIEIVGSGDTSIV